MKFYSVTSDQSINDIIASAILPCFTLKKVSWDDYGHKTTFILKVISKDETITEIGEVKIMDRDNDSTQIPLSFDKLGDQFCSLGQNISYYQKVSKLAKLVQVLLLEGLNDVAYDEKILRKFNLTSAFQDSLIRFQEASAALKNGKSFIQDSDKTILDSELVFNYRKKLPDALTDHFLEFDFSYKNNIPFRTNVFVGKNGTGKSSILRSLGEDVQSCIDSNKESKVLKKCGIDGNIYFDEVLYFNSSLFDKPSSLNSFFSQLNPFSDNNSEKALSKKVKNILQKLHRDKELPYWLDIIRGLLDSDVAKLFYLENSDLKKEGKDSMITESKLKKLSSGQKLLLLIVLELAKELKPRTLVLFDEPENHLHPNMLTSLIRSISQMLERTDSYCIYSTHSPLLLQETPSRSVHLFWRSGLDSRIEKLNFETFGESLHTIVDNVFNISNEESGFRSWLIEAKGLGVTKDEIEEELGKKLPLTANLVLGAPVEK